MLNFRPFSIMVVEDEIMIAENLCRKIEELPLPFTIMAKVSNGEDALKIIETDCPDVIFTDVRMPVMSGIQLAEQVYRRFPDTFVIIVSGYEEFEYARQAIKYGVMEYLLKPVSSEKLYETAQRLYAMLCEKRACRIRNLIELSLLGEGRPSGSEFGDLKFSLCLVKLGNLCKNDQKDGWTRLINDRWERIGLKRWLSDTLAGSENFWLVSGRDCSYKFVVSTSGNSKFYPRLFEYLHSATFPVTMCKVEKPVRLDEFYHMAVLSYRTLEERLIPCVDSLVTVSDVPVDYSEFQNSQFEKLDFGRPERLSSSLDELLRQWKEQRLPQICVESLLKKLLSSISKIDRFAIPEPLEFNRCMYELFLEDSSEDKLYGDISLFLKRILIMPMETEYGGAELYRMMKQYIKEHYGEEITMKTLSGIFHFSESYLSRIFKKYGEQSPIQYLLQVRMNIAKDMIAKYPELELRVVSEKVGYIDQHYFSRYFKQSFGVSPSGFKKQCMTG